MIPFISDDDLSAYLGTTVDGGTLGVQIALDSACQMVRDELHRDVNLLEDDQVTLQGTGTATLLLPQRPVVAVSEVQVQGEDDPVNPSEYEWDYGTGRLTLVSASTLVWPTWWRWDRIDVTYSHGWALSEDDVNPPTERVPSSIRLVALRLAAAVYRSTIAEGTSGGVVTSETIGSYTYRLEDGAAQAIASQALTDSDRASLRAWADLRVA